ncbi:MAG: amidohydrolase, partial [Firmicutes bacterium]|jgi:predicted amidohydrolase YtcJ|nr:amidohydrolase [Bacillota bacterium]
LGPASASTLESDPNTEIIDLAGHSVVPGLSETHSHIVWAAESEYHGEVFIPKSVRELLDYTSERVRALKRGEWVYFRNTYPTRLEEYRYPTLEELDAVAPENPVFIDGAYAGQANSCALAVAGIDENTPQPPVGEIVQDPVTRKPTGLFLRSQSLIARHFPGFPQVSEEERLQAITEVARRYNQLGITSVIEGWTTPTTIAAFNELYRRGALTLRMTYTVFPDAAQPRERIEEHVEEMFSLVETPCAWGKIRFLKSTVDGGILTGTALMRKAYGLRGDLHQKVFGHTDPGFRGVQTYDVDSYVRAGEVAYDLNLQMTAHCVGDAALDILFEAYRRIDESRPITGRRFSAIHGDFTDRATLEFMAEKGILNLGQMAWFYKDGAILSRILTPWAIRNFYPLRTMEELGVVSAGGSDHMVKWDSFESVNPYNPWLGMYAMVTRQTERGGVLVPEERISRESALRQYTRNGAYATFDEDAKGSIEVGKLADLAVVSGDYLTCPEEEIRGIRSLLTMVGGKIVYSEGFAVGEGGRS